ncbi:MAG: DsbC family protein [Rhodanobacteraceae bacterium]
MRIFVFVSGLIAGLLMAADVSAASPEDIVHQAMSALAPNVKIDAVQESEIPGFYEALAGGEFVYVSKDGRYVLDGSAYDVKNKRDLTALARARARKNALEKIGPDERIVFAPADPKYTVTVFTDVDCPFCRRFHQQIAEYNAKGIAVDYLFFPLSIHPGADKHAEAVWCSKDRPDAFTAAMAGKDPGKATCPTPVPELVKLGHSLGINGTPTVLAADGTQIAPQIAMSPDQLAAELGHLAKADAARN